MLFQQGLSKVTALSNDRPKQQKPLHGRKRTPKHFTPENDAMLPEVVMVADDGDFDAERFFEAEKRKTHRHQPPTIYPQDRDVSVTVTSRGQNVLAGLDYINTETTALDIQPLPVGTRLDSSTLVGSGEFQRYITPENFVAMDKPRGSQTVLFRGETLELGYVTSLYACILSGIRAFILLISIARSAVDSLCGEYLS